MRRSRFPSTSGQLEEQGYDLGLAILAVEEVAHRASSSFVCFLHRLAFVGVHAPLRDGAGGFRFAARWAAVGEAGLIRLELELL